LPFCSHKILSSMIGCSGDTIACEGWSAAHHAASRTPPGQDSAWRPPTVGHKCTIAVHDCTVAAHDCTVVVHDCTVVVHDCTVVVHHCIGVVQSCCF
jgi:hypothetical protein